VGSLGNTESTAYYFNRKAAVYYEIENFDEAAIAVKKAQKIDSVLGIKNWRYSSNLSIEGAIYRAQKKYKKSYEVVRKAYQFALENENHQEYFISLYNLISNFEKNKQNDSIVKYGKEFLSNTPKNFNKSFYHETYKRLGKAFYQLGDKDKAYMFADSSYQIAYDHMSDITEDRLKMYRASDELLQEQLQNKVLQAENKRKALLNYLLISILVGSSVIFLLIFGERRQYKKLSEAKQKINNQLNESIAFNNKLISIVAHDIRSPLSNISSVINLYKSGEIDEDMMGDLLYQLELGTDKTNQLLENLLRWIKSQDSEFKPNYSKVNIPLLISEVISELQMQFKTKGLKVEHDVEELEIKTDKDFLSIILRNLISNAIKFSDSGEKIIIAVNTKSTGHEIKIIDNGVGITTDQIEKINKGQQFSEWGTDSEKGTGLGVKLVKELLHTLGGSLSFESTKGKGTTAKVELPK
jgi:signal transduction histidine kinase